VGSCLLLGSNVQRQAVSRMQDYLCNKQSPRAAFQPSQVRNGYAATSRSSAWAPRETAKPFRSFQHELPRATGRGWWQRLAEGSRCGASEKRRVPLLGRVNGWLANACSTKRCAMVLNAMAGYLLAVTPVPVSARDNSATSVGPSSAARVVEGDIRCNRPFGRLCNVIPGCNEIRHLATIFRPGDVRKVER
jgi:hypothetical protein